MYTGCAVKNTARYCDRNAECITTLGGSQWCTGPKIADCYTYQRYPLSIWSKSTKSLLTPRAYAASVVLPDERIWVLGGAGSSRVLASTEFIAADESQITQITAGPDLPKPLMGLCAAMLSDTEVMVIGGFSPVINDYSPNAYIYDLTTSKWTNEGLMGPGSRLDSACLNVNLGGISRFVFAGGWNNEALSDWGYLDAKDLLWKNFLGSGSNPDPLPFPLRSSVMVEHNTTYYLIGGVECQAPGRPCSQTSKGKPASY